MVKYKDKNHGFLLKNENFLKKVFGFMLKFTNVLCVFISPLSSDNFEVCFLTVSFNTLLIWSFSIINTYHCKMDLKRSILLLLLTESASQFQFRSQPSSLFGWGRGGGRLWFPTFFKSYFHHWYFPGHLHLCHWLRHAQYFWNLHFHNLFGDPVPCGHRK